MSRTTSFFSHNQIEADQGEKLSHCKHYYLFKCINDQDRHSVTALWHSFKRKNPLKQLQKEVSPSNPLWSHFAMSCKYVLVYITNIILWVELHFSVQNSSGFPKQPSLSSAWETEQHPCWIRASTSQAMRRCVEVDVHIEMACWC